MPRRSTQAAEPARRHGARAATAWRTDADVLSLVRATPVPRVFRLATQHTPVEMDLNRCALVVVDMQNDFCHPEGWLAQKGVSVRATRRPIPLIAELTRAWRAAGGPVVWLNWGVRPDVLNLPASARYKASRPGADGRPGVGYAEASPLDRGPSLVPGHWGAQVVDELAPMPGDIVVHKHRLSGFWDTELDSVLRQLGTTTLLFAGVNTDRCVFSTLTDAAALGYDCVLLKDACGSCSPNYVVRAVCHLVELLHGFVASADDLIPALNSLPRG